MNNETGKSYKGLYTIGVINVIMVILCVGKIQNSESLTTNHIQRNDKCLTEKLEVLTDLSIKMHKKTNELQIKIDKLQDQIDDIQGLQCLTYDMIYKNDQ